MPAAPALIWKGAFTSTRPPTNPTCRRPFRTFAFPCRRLRPKPAPPRLTFTPHDFRFYHHRPNDGVSGTAVPSNHHSRRRYFARPAPTARPRRSRVRCTRGWAQTRRQTEKPPTAHLQKTNGSSGEQATDGNKPHHHCTASRQRTQPTLPAWRTLIIAGVFQFRLRLSPPQPACRLCLNPGHYHNDSTWPFRALGLPRWLQPIATTAVEPLAPLTRLLPYQPTHGQTVCRAKSQSVCRQASTINQMTLSPRPACLWLFKVLALQQPRWPFLLHGLKATCAFPSRFFCLFTRALA